MPGTLLSSRNSVIEKRGSVASSGTLHVPRVEREEGDLREINKCSLIKIMSGGDTCCGGDPCRITPSTGNRVGRRLL